MKKYLAVILSVALFVSFCGCAPASDGDVYGECEVEAGYCGNRDFYNAALNAGLLDSGDKEHLPIFKMENFEEMNQFIADYSDILQTNNLTYYYNENTVSVFEENTVLLVYKPTNSVSYRYRIKAKNVIHSTSICLYIEQSNDPENIDNAMSGWFLCLELPKDIVNKAVSFDAVFEK